MKPWPVVCMALWAAWDARGSLGRLVAAGLLVSAVADVALDLHFLAGLAIFLVAQLVYVAAFVADERALRPLCALPFAAYGAGMSTPLSPDLGAMALPVAGYVLAISAMMWRAAARVRAGRRAAWCGLAGALAFGLSDTMLGLDHFRADPGRAGPGHLDVLGRPARHRRFRPAFDLIGRPLEPAVPES